MGLLPLKSLALVVGLMLGLLSVVFFFRDLLQFFFFLKVEQNFFFFNWRVFLNLIKGVPNFFLRVNK